VQPIALGHLIADGIGRVERGHRLLEDHGDALAAQPVHLLLGQGGQIARLEGQTPGAAPGAARQQVHQGQRRHRLATARFADKAQCFPCLDRQRHVTDGMDGPRHRRQIDREVLDLKQRVRHGQRSDVALMSRNPSPARLMAKIRMASAVPGMAISQNEKNM